MAKSDIETIVGNLSWYQLFMWFVPSTYMMLFGLNNVLPVFVQAEPNFTCKVFENQTWVEANSTTNNCGMEHNNCKIPGSNSSDTTNCEDFVFDRSEYDDSVVTEFNLVCDNAWISSLSTSIYFLLLGLGGLVTSYMSDKYGRKPVLFISGVANVILSAAEKYKASDCLSGSLNFCSLCSNLRHFRSTHCFTVK